MPGDKERINHMNHINDRCTEYSHPKLLGGCYGAPSTSVSAEIAGIFRNCYMNYISV